MFEQEGLLKLGLRVRKENIPVYILLGIFALLALTVFSIHNKYSAEMKRLGDRIATISNSNLTLQDVLRKVVRENRDYKMALEQEVQREQALRVKIQDLNLDMSEKRGQISNMGLDINSLKKENDQLKENFRQLSEAKEALGGRVASLSRIEENLQKKISRLLTRTKVDLGQMVIKPSSIHGNIIKANSRYNFIIIDLGKNDGMKPGMHMMVCRDDKQIGEVRIEKVYDELCVGKATFDWAGNEVTAGDSVNGRD